MSKNQYTPSAINDEIIREISGAVKNITYGTVSITVHNSRITQIEVSEKKRFDNLWKFEKGGGI